MSYWDTSALVKLYASESDSAAFENYAADTPGPIIVSTIGLYEARATFIRKEIDGALQPNAASVLYSKLAQDVTSGQVLVIALNTDIEREYGQVLDLCYRNPNPGPIPLRTLDALHLASCRVAGETEIVATDKRLRDAARQLNLSLFPT